MFVRFHDKKSYLDMLINTDHVTNTDHITLLKANEDKTWTFWLSDASLSLSAAWLTPQRIIITV